MIYSRSVNVPVTPELSLNIHLNPELTPSSVVEALDDTPLITSPVTNNPDDLSL